MFFFFQTGTSAERLNRSDRKKRTRGEGGIPRSLLRQLLLLLYVMIPQVVRARKKYG